MGALTTPLLAQEGAFGEAITGIQLTSEERTALGMDGQTLGDTLEFVRFDELPSGPTSDGLTFRLDTTGASYAFDVRLYDSEAGTDFRLAGDLAGHTFYITYNPSSGYRGSGSIGNTGFDFHPLTDRISRILFTDHDLNGTDITCAHPLGEPTNPTETTTPCEGIIDVLYLRSAAADTRLPTYQYIYNFEDFVYRINDLANMSLANSNLGGIKFNPLFHSSTVEVPTTNFNIFHISEVVIADNYIKQLRQQYDADIVAYYPDHTLVHSGIAGGIVPPYSRAYHTTGMEQELNDFARLTINKHELGHIVGGYHHRKHDFFSPDPNDMPDWLRTTMGSGVHHTRIADHYSNPDVNYEFPLGGPVPTGTTTNNNAVLINHGACVVKDYESFGSLRSQAIVKPDVKNPCSSPVQLCARVDAGNNGGPNGGPYTYEWRWSIAPGAATTLLSTNACVNFARPFAQQSTYYVTLEVRSSVSGQSTFSYTGVNFDAYCNISVPTEDETPRTANFNDLSETLQVPYTLSGQRRYLSVAAPTPDAELEFSVYDPIGRMVVTQRTYLSAGGRLAADVPAGLYFVTLTDPTTGAVLATSAVHHIIGR